MSNFVEELRWRGLLNDIIPGTEEQLLKEKTIGYIGFDPTADSLHIGSLIPILILKHFQLHGHQPIALIGGATGMIGDPTGKSDERNLLDEQTLQKNVAGIRAVLSRFLDFDSDASNKAILVNNYDWMRDFSFLDFIRNVGKRITVNYMMAKDSVKKRISGETGSGMSFTEFTYQLIQGFDFYHLYSTMNCKLQMGGSDQWGNITTGTELIRRMSGGNTDAYALTCPLITKSDGTKFGKSEGGNIWLDKDKTSVYKFYQFWLNTADEDAERFIKFYTFLSKEIINTLVEEHAKTPHLRILQHRLAQEITTLVHGKQELEKAIQASQILFGKTTSEHLKQLDNTTFLDIFEGVPMAHLSVEEVKNSDIVSLLSQKSGFLKSLSEARRAIKEGSISLNKEKVSDENYTISEKDFIQEKFILFQRGKKNYFVIVLS